MTTNKKLLIGLACLAFCVCCAIFGFGFKGKNSLVAQADTIPQAPSAVALAAPAKSIKLDSHEAEDQAVTEEPIEDEEEVQDIECGEYYEDEGKVEIEEFYEETFNEEDESILISVSGRVGWADANHYDDPESYVSHPLRKILLRIYGNGKLLAKTYTNDSGEYSVEVSIVPGCDIEVYAYPGDDNVMVKDQDGREYNIRVALRKNVRGNRDNINSTIFTNDNIENKFTSTAFQISQALITARDFAEEMMGRTPSPVTLLYPKSNHAYYYDGGTIHLCYDYYKGYPYTYASWDLIMHEYGHHIQYELGIKNSPSGVDAHYSNHNDADDLEDKDKGIRLAWAEAWPTVFGMIAQRYYTIEKKFLNGIPTVGDSYYTAYNKLNYDINTDAAQLGEACEDSIMGVLWDLFDDDVENNDTIALGYQEFWNVTTVRGITTFSDFINHFYGTYPKLINEIGANLSYYKISAYDLSVTDDSLNNLPTFSWKAGGGSDKYPNNYFLLAIYDANNTEIFNKVVTSNSYTLSMAEAQKISYWDSNISWVVETANYHEYIYTGPYITQKINKPYKVFEIGLNRSIRIESGEAIWFFKFIAPSTGKFIFYTEGGSDTYGEAYSQIPNYKKYFLASDDNSGDNKNFKIELNLQKNQCVYIKVTPKVFWLHYSMRVKQE